MAEDRPRGLAGGFGLGPERVSRLFNGIETDIFRPNGIKKRKIVDLMLTKMNKFNSFSLCLKCLLNLTHLCFYRQNLPR
mgnify:CR=1 FL=1